MRSGVAQSFLESVTAPAGTPPDAGHDAGSPTGGGSCDCCCRCGRNIKWQPLGPGRKRRSKSYTAPRTGISELSGLDFDLPRTQEPLELDAPKHYGPGEAPLERLPVEVLGKSSQAETYGQLLTWFRRDYLPACSRSPACRLRSTECGPDQLSFDL